MTDCNDAGDLILGAEPIGDHIFGVGQGKRNKRRVFHMHSQGQLPTFKLGGLIAMRKSTYAAHVARLEAAARGEAA
jgi:hypothetical protein